VDFQVADNGKIGDDKLGKYGFTTESGRTQRGKDIFFVYREIPIDEKNLSDQMHDRSIVDTMIRVNRGPGIVFVDEDSTCRGLSASAVDYP